MADGQQGRQINLGRSEEHTSELQSQSNLVCRLLLEKKKCDARSSSEAADVDGLDLVPNAVRRARSEGADAAEAYAIAFTSRPVYIEDDVQMVAEDRSETCLGV